MITAVLPQTTDTIPAVLPSALSPLPRYYRGSRPHYRAAHYSAYLVLSLATYFTYLLLNYSKKQMLLNILNRMRSSRELFDRPSYAVC